MIDYLFQHGAGNLLPAMIEAIRAHQNNFVRSCIDTPFTSLVPLVEATLESDNLEILRLLAPRLTRAIEIRPLSNRTSYWLCCFNRITNLYDFVNEYSAGFGLDDTFENQRVADAIASDLSEPLPFSYDQFTGEMRYGVFASGLSVEIREGRSHNYERLEWLLDRAWSQGHFGDRILDHDINRWIDALLPMIRDPRAKNVLEKAGRYLGLRWFKYLNPISPRFYTDQVWVVMGAMGASYGRVPDFDPPQPEVRKEWLEKYIETGSRAQKEEALDWILFNYPGRDDSYFKPGEQYRYRIPDSMGIDLHDAILRLFAKDSYLTIQYILKHRQMELYDELPSIRYSDAADLCNAACTAGLDSVVGIYLQQSPRFVLASRIGKWFRLQNLFGSILYREYPPRQEIIDKIPQVESLFSSRQEWLNERLSLVI